MPTNNFTIRIRDKLLIFIQNIAKGIISTSVVPRHVLRFSIFAHLLFKHCTVTNQIFAIAYIRERLSNSFVNRKSRLLISVVIVEKKKCKINRTSVSSSNVRSPPLVFYQIFLSAWYF